MPECRKNMEIGGIINYMETRKDPGGKIGKYTIVKMLGEGGEGCVYLARDETLQRLAAVKQVRESCGALGEGAEPEQDQHVRIREEADFLQHLKHPMLPVVYDLIRADSWYLVMEYIQGITLREYIGKNGYTDKDAACQWASQILDILEYLHTRRPPVIYRDLKPDNLMVCPDGRLRLVDFGAAGRRKFDGKSEERMAATPGFGAPEQFGRCKCGEYENRGDASAHGCGNQGIYADERSDIYAFGKVLYYMVTGADPAKPPYTALSVRDYQPLLPKRLDWMIQKCIREDPAERYQVVEEIRKELRRCGKRNRCLRRRSFIRVVEKKIWLTEM